MNVAEQFQQLGIFLDEERLEAVLKDVACPLGPAVETDSVAGVEGPHEVRQGLLQSEWVMLGWS